MNGSCLYIEVQLNYNIIFNIFVYNPSSLLIFLSFSKKKSLSFIVFSSHYHKHTSHYYSTLSGLLFSIYHTPCYVSRQSIAIFILHSIIIYVHAFIILTHHSSLHVLFFLFYNRSFIYNLYIMSFSC